MSFWNDFFDNLPTNFTVLDFTSRWSYFNSSLPGFSSLNNVTQSLAASTYKPEDKAVVLEYIEYAAKNGFNATVSWVFSTIWDVPVATTVAPNNPCTPENIAADNFGSLLLPGVAICCVVGFIQRRTRIKPGCCCGRPSIAYPVNFIDEGKRRVGFAVAYMLIAYFLLEVLFGELFLDFAIYYTDPVFKKNFGWTRTFLVLANVILVGIVGYPWFVCLTLRRYIVANILGILGIIPAVYARVVYLIICPVKVDPDLSPILAYIEILVTDAPIMIGLAILAFTYLFDLCLNIKRKCVPMTKKEKEEEFTPYLIYTRALLKRGEKTEPETFLEKIKAMRYEARVGYTYSPRVICTMAIVVICLYRLGVAMGIGLDVVFPVVKHHILPLIKPLLKAQNQTHVYPVLLQAVDVIRYSFMVGNILSLVLHFVFTIVIVVTFRKHTLQLLKGDRSWHHERAYSPTSSTIACLKYPGYQIAHFMYGYLIMAAILTLVGILLAFLIVIPIKNGESNFVLDALFTLWPSALVTIFILLAQVLITKFVFLQDNGKWLALTNRRGFHVFTYFAFFFNTVVGVFSCLKRILLSVVFGTFLMCRLDRCLFMRGFERFDAGFSAYLGMLDVDVTHNHPIVKTFVALSWQTLYENYPSKEGCDNPALEVDVENEKSDVELKRPMKKLWPRNKWRLSMTLINNPHILADRWKTQILEERKKAKEENTKEKLIFEAIDTTANVATGMVAVAGLAAYEAATSMDEL